MKKKISKAENIGPDASKRKVTVADVKRTYTMEKAHLDLFGGLWHYLTLRPISFYLTPFFINLGFSANAVTTLGLLHLVAGLVFTVLGAKSSAFFVVGAIFINVWYLYDVIDGNIARFQKKTSKFGFLFDWLMGVVHSVFAPLCLGLGLYLSSAQRPVFDFGLALPSWFWLLIGGVEALAVLLREGVSKMGRLSLGEKTEGCVPDKLTLMAIMPRAIVSFRIPLLLVAAIFNGLGVLITCYAAYNAMSLVGVIVQVLRKASRMDKKKNDS